MNISTIILYILSISFLIISLIKDKEKTKVGIKKGFMAFIKIIPVLIPLFLIVGILLTYITPQMITNMIGEDSGFIGVAIGSILGSLAFMPPFVTFPLAAELLQNGAGYSQVAAFVTTLMGVGIVYIQAESRFFGTASTLRRNILAFIAAIIVSLVVGGLM